MKHLSRVFIAICFIILYAPILVLMLFSFNSTASTGVFSGFSLYWYGELFKSGDVFNALRNTLILAVSDEVTASISVFLKALNTSPLLNSSPYQ